MPDPKTLPPKKPRASPTKGSVLAFVDRNLMWSSAGLVAFVWIIAEIFGHSLSQGAQAALGTFIAMASYKAKTDSRWRELELEQQETKQLLAALEKTAPGSPEAVTVRRALAEKNKRAQGSSTEEEP